VVRVSRNFDGKNLPVEDPIEMNSLYRCLNKSTKGIAVTSGCNKEEPIAAMGVQRPPKESPARSRTGEWPPEGYRAKKALKSLRRWGKLFIP